ncbi:hypothetical protein BDC45DRAFT_541050 [Circinella umbellata]|nr:hypothetical protein BDC45DRAFT_541050 [Circinella umbellata]
MKNASDQYDVEPIVIILSIHLIPSQILNTLSNTGSFSYMKIMPSDHWAQRVYFLDLNIIEESLPEEPLPPLVEEINIVYKNIYYYYLISVAIKHVFSSQKQSLFSLEKKDDPIVKLLYAIAKKALDNGIQKDEKTIDALLDVCSNAKSQFKRILDAVTDEDHPDVKRIKQYASDGARYTATCTSKFFQQGSSDHQPQDVLREIPTITKREMDKQWIKEFIDRYKSENRKMNWKACYELGLQEGYFKSYKSYKSLKSSYHNWSKNKKEKS